MIIIIIMINTYIHISQYKYIAMTLSGVRIGGFSNHYVIIILLFFGDSTPTGVRRGDERYFARSESSFGSSQRGV